MLNNDIALVSLVLTNETTQTAGTLRDEIVDLVGEGQAPSRRQIRKYFSLDFLPAGLAAENDGPRRAREFTTSIHGRTFGIPVASYALLFGYEHGVSLRSYLGPGNLSGDKRPPEQRIAILECLARNSASSINRLSDVLDKERVVVRSHLSALEHEGLVKSSSWKGEKDQAPYTWTGDKGLFEITPVETYTRLTRRIAEELERRGTAGPHAISKQLNYTNMPSLCHILRGLVAQGAARQDGWKGNERFSQVTLTQQGHDFFYGFVTTVWGAAAGKGMDVLDDAARQLEDKAFWRNVARTQIRRYQEASYQ